MKKLVVYYSRTGATKKIGSEIATKLKADKEEIIDKKNRKGPIGYIIAGKDAIAKKLTEIANLKKNPEKYDLVVIGTPIWGYTMAPAIRTFLTRIKNYNKKVAFFCTMGGSGDEKTFAAMKELLPKAKLMATAALTTKEVQSNQHEKKLQEFINIIKK